MNRRNVTVADILPLVAELTTHPPHNWRAHPALTEGCLLVTPEQYDQIKAWADDQYWREQHYLKPVEEQIGDIEVVVVYPLRPARRIGTKGAYNLDGTIYVFDWTRLEGLGD